jgi:hypothetical protein
MFATNIVILLSISIQTFLNNFTVVENLWKTKCFTWKSIEITDT